jgi:hypothetical protein
VGFTQEELSKDIHEVDSIAKLSGVEPDFNIKPDSTSGFLLFRYQVKVNTCRRLKKMNQTLPDRIKSYFSTA